MSETCSVLFQNKFEKFVYLFAFIIGIYHDERSPESQIYYLHYAVLDFVCFTYCVYHEWLSVPPLWMHYSLL